MCKNLYLYDPVLHKYFLNWQISCIYLFLILDVAKISKNMCIYIIIVYFIFVMWLIDAYVFLWPESVLENYLKKTDQKWIMIVKGKENKTVK